MVVWQDSPETSPRSRNGLPTSSSALLYSFTGAGRGAGAGLLDVVVVGLLVLFVGVGSVCGMEQPLSTSANKQRGKARIEIPLPFHKSGAIEAIYGGNNKTGRSPS